MSRTTTIALIGAAGIAGIVIALRRRRSICGDASDALGFPQSWCGTFERIAGEIDKKLSPIVGGITSAIPIVGGGRVVRCPDGRELTGDEIAELDKRANTTGKSVGHLWPGTEKSKSYNQLLSEFCTQIRKGDWP